MIGRFAAFFCGVRAPTVASGLVVYLPQRLGGLQDALPGERETHPDEILKRQFLAVAALPRFLTLL
jgi:hypothetical protein